MSTDRIERRLADLALFGEQAAYVVAKGREAYLADTMDAVMLRNAAERVLIKVATVVEKLPTEFTDRYPDIDWRGIGRMRNLIAHHYDAVNDDLMWAALEARIPDLIRQLGLDSRRE